MKNRRNLIVALGAAAFFPRSLVGQTKKPPVVIGWLEGGSSAGSGHRLIAFKEGLTALGWKDGAQYVIEERWAEGKADQALPLAVELAAKKPAVIVAAPNRMVQLVAKAAPNIPIVQANGGSPVRFGLAKSHVRPGGMVTGLTNLTGSGEDSLVEKYIEMLLLAAPKLRRVGILGDATAVSWDGHVKIHQRACTHFKIECRFLRVTRASELESAFAKMRSEGIEALVVQSGDFFMAERQGVADHAVKERWPMIAGAHEFAHAGALLSYGADRTENFRRAAYYVDKILKGAKPGELPIEQPHRVELVVNNKTAKALGLKLPPELLVRADKLLE